MSDSEKLPPEPTASVEKGREAEAEPDLSSDSEGDGERKHFTISQTLFETLLLNGFSENAIKKSIVAGCIDEKTCTQWIKMHEGHPELDTPLEDGVEVEVKVKRVLTESEREEKVRELQEKIKLKKEEERLEAARKERERIEMGRKALEVKEEMDAVRRKLELEEVRRQKAADAAARRNVKIQIIADRYVRQGKGSDEAWKLAEKDVEAEAEKARVAAAARAEELRKQNQQQHAPTVANSQANGDGGGGWNLAAVVGDTSEEDRVRNIFTDPEAGDEDSIAVLVASLQAAPGAAKCLSTLRTILANVLSAPLDVKKRTLKTSTKAFTQNLRPFEAALRLLRLCNFALAADGEGVETISCSTVVIWKLEEVLQAIPSES